MAVASAQHAPTQDGEHAPDAQGGGGRAARAAGALSSYPIGWRCTIMVGARAGCGARLRVHVAATLGCVQRDWQAYYRRVANEPLPDTLCLVVGIQQRTSYSTQ